jgi:hypothetical protein
MATQQLNVPHIGAHLTQHVLAYGTWIFLVVLLRTVENGTQLINAVELSVVRHILGNSLKACVPQT